MGTIVEKYIQADSMKIFYDIHNDKKTKTVVLVHGFGLDRDMWRMQLDVLQDFKVICLDVRGHGKSRPCDVFGVIKVCEDIKCILDMEKCDSAVIIGLSMGSYVAQEFVRLYSKLTRGIMVADGTPIYIKYPKWETLSLKYSAPLLKLYTWKNLKKTMASQTSINIDVRNELIRMFEKQTKKEFILSYAGIANALHEEKVDIKCPFFVVYGDKDKAGTIQIHAKDWKIEYPNCKIYKIPNAGHVSNMDNPQEFNRIMLDFLKEVYVDFELQG